ncbi:MAG: DNA-primase RepB domain-containing protein [Vicinamibacterales bacterium]
MADITRGEPIRFLRVAFDSDDWVAVFLKTYRTGETAQRVVPLATAASDRFQAWLRHRNAAGWNVYVSVNAVHPGRSRTRRAIAAVRHVFLEEDNNGLELVATLAIRPDLPPPSYVLHSSPGRLHVFWRVRDFSPNDVEVVQKQLAKELRTDRAATSCAQTTRLPGFVNHKRERACAISIEYLRPGSAFTPADFPLVSAEPARSVRLPGTHVHVLRMGDRIWRARQYLAAAAPAVAGEHGDLRTFRICCRLVRGFDLSEDEALRLLGEWNDRCVPPWSERDLIEKLSNARTYGREPIGGLLSTPVAQFRNNA